MSMPRFTIRNLLQATFWACLWGTALINFKHFGDIEDAEKLVVFRPVLSFVIAGPFIIVGSAVGRGWKGLTIGMSIALSLIILLVALAVAVR